MLRFRQRGVDNRQPLGSLPVWLSAILRSRGMDTEEKAARFLDPSLEHLHDPYLMQGMDKAVAMIRNAVADGTPIQIYGDYDADGVCATSIMMETLTHMGADVAYRIPSRHGEGYGLNCDAVREIAQSRRLLITVDCGVTNHEEVRLAQLLGMTVIVTDHHQLAETPSPADVVLNPLLGEYPFRRLCGAGVALKLCQALLGMDEVLKRIDLAALATVADLVPLIDENRVIVRYGMQKMADGSRPGLASLMTLAAVNLPVTSDQIAFKLAPRINAGGRLEDASQCVRLLTSTDEQEAQEIAKHLEQQNQQRQALQQEITQKAEADMRENVDFRDDLAIIVMGEDWNSGVIGLAAGRICEQYHFPTIVLSKQGDIAVGSCRSIPGVNIHAMLTACSDLFIRFGGHEQAAGLTMQASLVPELRRRINLLIRERCDLNAYIPVKEYDAELSLGEVDLELVERLSALQPTGFGNPAPVFLCRDAHVQQARPVGKDLSHLKLTLLENGALLDGIAFRQGALASEGLETVDVLYAPDRNEFRGRVSAQLQVQALQPSLGRTNVPDEQRIFVSVLQEILQLAAYKYDIPAELEPAAAASVERMLGQGRGVLLIGHERNRAKEYADKGLTDFAVNEVRDLRGFNTLLAAPELDKLTDTWQHIVLLDGDVLPGEAAAIRTKCPRARLYALKPNPVFSQLLQSIRVSKEALRELYKAARAGGPLRRGDIAQRLGMTEQQVVTGLTALHQVELVRFSPEPFALVMLPMQKRDPMDSQLMQYLQAIP